MTKSKTRVAVLMGGKSPEYEVSLMTGREVIRHLNPKKYDVLPVLVSRDGVSWQIGGGEQSFFLNSPGLQSMETNLDKNIVTKTDHVSIVKRYQIDIVFIAMHGPYGEDGRIQGFLDLIGVPYTGSGVLPSALGMDKLYSRHLFAQAGLVTPQYVLLEKGDVTGKVWQKLKIPVFVHPHNQGSAVGSSLVKRKRDLSKALRHAFKYSNIVLVDEFIKGKEITCAILGNKRPQPLPLVEIKPKHDYFDYESKYNPGLADEIVPARIGKNLTKRAQEAAVIAYKAIGCKDFGRVDMIVRNNKIYVLEVNTIPGLTSVSLFPKAAREAGYSYSALLDKIISLALESKADEI